MPLTMLQFNWVFFSFYTIVLSLLALILSWFSILMKNNIYTKKFTSQLDVIF